MSSTASRRAFIDHLSPASAQRAGRARADRFYHAKRINRGISVSAGLRRRSRPWYPSSNIGSNRSGRVAPSSRRMTRNRLTGLCLTMLVALFLAISMGTSVMGGQPSQRPSYEALGRSPGADPAPPRDWRFAGPDSPDYQRLT